MINRLLWYLLDRRWGMMLIIAFATGIELAKWAVVCGAAYVAFWAWFCLAWVYGG